MQQPKNIATIEFTEDFAGIKSGTRKQYSREFAFDVVAKGVAKYCTEDSVIKETNVKKNKNKKR